MSKLKSRLFEEYGGFADKRIKNLERGDLFVIDDRGATDFGADKQLYPWFCLLFLEVEDEDAPTVVMRGNVPLDRNTRAAIASAGGLEEGSSIRLAIPKGRQDLLAAIADAISGIVAPGKRYSTPSFKYVCPRTANSLRRLKVVLDDVWSA